MISKKDNVYWPVYKNLEHEVLEIAYHIHFDDTQTDVYSVKISELLLRCAIEIEAIAKELYEENGGYMHLQNDDGHDRDLFFDTDFLKFLDQKWSLAKKQIDVSGINFYFTKLENQRLTPLKNAEKHGKCDWKCAYQAVKHNRSKEIKKANVKNLIRAMAALYLLNIYYKDESFEFGIGSNIFKRKEFDYSLGSDIFSVHPALSIYFSARTPVKNNICLDNEEDFKQVYVFMPTDNKAYMEYVKTFRQNSGISTDNPKDLLKKHAGSIANMGKNANGETQSFWVDGNALKIFNRIQWRLELNKNQSISL
jgi:hypothetical protein